MNDDTATPDQPMDVDRAARISAALGERLGKSLIEEIEHCTPLPCVAALAVWRALGLYLRDDYDLEGALAEVLPAGDDTPEEMA